MQAALKYYNNGFASDLMSPAQLDEIFGHGRKKPMPKFEIVQSSGKHRAITDGSRYGHNDASSYSETIDTCTALQPARHVRALASAGRRLGVSLHRI